MVLAMAGLRRLGRADEAGVPLAADRFVPAAGQGLLALETRIDDTAAEKVQPLEDPAARLRLEVERAVVAALDASCNTPVGVHARVGDGKLTLHAFVGLPDGSEWITDRVESESADSHVAGTELARRMLAAGAGELLRRAESTLGP
jgi:hydroxymethylbilane synthase